MHKMQETRPDPSCSHVEAFIKKKKLTKGINIAWIHPSYCDLVIEKISNDYEMAERLMKHATIDIIKRAVSDAGGEHGKRSFPFLNSEHLWRIFEERCLQLVNEQEEHEISVLLKSLHSAFSHTNEKFMKDKISNVSKQILKNICNKWNIEEKALKYITLEAYFQLSIIVYPMAQSPDLEPSWVSSVEKIKDGIRLWKEDSFIEYSKFTQWVDLLEVINDYEPRFLKHVSFPEGYKNIIQDFIEFCEHELESDIVSDYTAETLRGFADELTELRNSLEKLSRFLVKKDSNILNLIDELESKAESLNDEALEIEGPEPDYDDYSNSFSSADDFDINKLFVDL